MANQYVPDFESVQQDTTLPEGATEEVLELYFSGTMLSGYRAVTIADTVIPGSNIDLYDKDTDERLRTLVVRFPRPILSEINTHRVFSRNSASSRARSMKTTLREVMEEPYVPLFTKNQRGMSGVYLTKKERAEAVEEWLVARDAAVLSVLNLLLKGSGKELNATQARNLRENYLDYVDMYHQMYLDKDPSMLSPHKQNTNRLLEPFMWHEAIITADKWQNFLDLRDHEAAQPEIRAIAVLMREALDKSTPVESTLHTPFAGVLSTEEAQDIRFDDFWKKHNDTFMTSSGNSARVSYVSKIDGSSKDSVQLGYRLLEEKHLSPFEHAAISREAFIEMWQQYTDRPLHVKELQDNFSDSWVQYRTLLDKVTEVL